jgi:hypothetical protein
MRQATTARTAAYAAAVLFGIHLLTYFVPSVRDATLANAPALAVALAVLAIAQHLVVFPVVAALPAPTWAKVAGYGWLIVDMGTDLLQLAGASKSIYLTLRLVINLVAALWIASASLQASGGMRGIGIFVAIDFALYSLLASFFPAAFLVVLPSLLLLPVWFVLSGRRIGELAAT